MKNYLLLFLFLLIFVPTISFGAEMRTLNVEFSFTAPDDQAKQLLGFRLYKEGTKVCETNTPSASMVSCQLLTEDGTFDFTLTAHYTDGAESPHSASFPFTIGSTSVTPPATTPVTPPATAPVTPPATDPVTPPATDPVTPPGGSEIYTLNVEFSFTAPDDPTRRLLGYKLYKEGVQVCETNDPNTSRIICELPSEDGTFHLSLTAYYSNNTESPPSPSFPFTIGATSGTASDPGTASPELPTAVLSSSTAAGSAPLKVTFDGTSSTTPNSSIAQYNWTFGDGSQASGATTSHTFTTAGTYYTQLTVVDSQGLSDTVSTPVVVSAPAPVVSEPATVNDKPIAEIPAPGISVDDPIKIEVGEIRIDHNWVTVAFEKAFSRPVVIAGPPTFNDSEPVLVRIRNLNETGFEIRLQEWDYQDDRHDMETFSYMVIEEGVYTLDNGSKLEAGHFDGSSSFGQVALQQPYTVTPVILTQVVTENETDAVTGRINNINQYSFEYKLQEMQKTASTHIPETIGYLAWEPGKGEISGLLYEIGTTAKNVTHDWFNLNFETKFPDLPFFIAGMQTYADRDTAVVRNQNLSTSATQIKIEEEQSTDSEVYHIQETVGYFSISAPSE